LEVLDEGIAIGLREPIDPERKFIVEIVKFPRPPSGEP
jgi:hypothetical protein